MSTYAMRETRNERDQDRKTHWRRPLCLQIGILRHPYRTIRNHFRPKPYSPTPHFPSSASVNPLSNPFIPRRPDLTPSTSAESSPISPTETPPPSPVTFRRLSFFSIRSESTGTRSTFPKLGRRSSQREEETVEVLEGDGEREEEWWWYRGGPDRRQVIEMAEIDEYVRRVQWENDW